MTAASELSLAPEASDNTSYNLQIQGMSCAGCVSSVERSLKSVPGVSEAVVNLPNETARV